MLRFYSYWRSSAAYRVRIALHLKGLPFETVSCRLSAGRQRTEEYLAANPQGLVPALDVEGRVLCQSLAIIDYLDRIAPEPPLYPRDPADRAQVAGMAQAVACDIHPLNNLRVLNYLRGPLGQDEAAVSAWYAHWIREGFQALEAWAGRYSSARRHLFGDAVTAADCCLVPQMYNARRFGVPLDAFPALCAIDTHLTQHPAFIAAAPELQPDAVTDR